MEQQQSSMTLTFISWLFKFASKRPAFIVWLTCIPTCSAFEYYWELWIQTWRGTSEIGGPHFIFHFDNAIHILVCNWNKIPLALLPSPFSQTNLRIRERPTILVDTICYSSPTLSLLHRIRSYSICCVYLVTASTTGYQSGLNLSNSSCDRTMSPLIGNQ